MRKDNFHLALVLGSGRDGWGLWGTEAHRPYLQWTAASRPQLTDATDTAGPVVLDQHHFPEDPGNQGFKVTSPDLKCWQLAQNASQCWGHLGGLVGSVSNFSSGHDLIVHGFKPHIEFCTGSVEPAWDSPSVSLSLSAPPLLACMCIHSLSK